MYRRSEPCLRRGATLAEMGLVLSISVGLTLAVVVFGLGVYRYQQVAALAREGARWASVHGGQWANGGTLTTQTDVKNVITPMAVGLESSQFTSTNPAVSWDDSAQKQTTSAGATNYVTVTVTYSWVPEVSIGPVFSIGPQTLSSTARMPMQY